MILKRPKLRKAVGSKTEEVIMGYLSSRSEETKKRY
jgi:hypothetical protein